MPPLRLIAYPNVGLLQGEVELRIPVGAGLQQMRVGAARQVLNSFVEPEHVRFFGISSDWAEIFSIEELRREAARACGGVVVTAGADLRSPPPSSPAQPADDAPRRYDPALVGGQVLRVSADDPELPSLLRCSVPILITGSGLVGRASKLWTFANLDGRLADIDNFYVLCSPAESRGRFAYYDLTRNPCGYDVKPTNERVLMRFVDFRRKVEEARKNCKDGNPKMSYYLQNTLFHREDGVGGPPKPVGGFGSNCGIQMMKDISAFRWDWLKQMMGGKEGREPQMCQFFCGIEGGFSPCHYDPQDNMFVQVRGFKRVLLFHPRHTGCLYPWPVHHPQDRQSRIDFDNPDLECFPGYSELKGRGIEAVIGPGDILHIPPGWYHQIEMLPSPPDGEVVSFNFWYDAPTWFYGDPEKGNIDWDVPLSGSQRTFYKRAIEELIGKIGRPEDVEQVVRTCARMSRSGSGEPEQGDLHNEVVQTVSNFVQTVFPDSGERYALLNEILDGRFLGLTRAALAA